MPAADATLAASEVPAATETSWTRSFPCWELGALHQAWLPADGLETFALCCQPLRSLLPFQKHYFPIDYTVQVQYEEVLRPSNITRLRNGTVSEAALRYLWFHVSSQALLRIREVLPEKHPSWKYTQELCQLFDALGREYSKYRQVRRPPARAPVQTHGTCTDTRVVHEHVQYLLTHRCAWPMC
uniref:Interleukin 34 n=1 Tax=Apteryx owenii TaxID=8824 RepID=A0A8B9Q5T0_APTOW